MTKHLYSDGNNLDSLSVDSIRLKHADGDCDDDGCEDDVRVRDQRQCRSVFAHKPLHLHVHDYDEASSDCDHEHENVSNSERTKLN